MNTKPTIRPITAADKISIADLLIAHWDAVQIVSRGKVVDASTLPGFVAENSEHEIVGLITLHPESDACEIVTLDAFVKGAGIGKALMAAAVDFALAKNLNRLWLITSNDNVDALGFYQKLGLRITQVHVDAVTDARKLKPQIPLVAENGIAICDEIELSLNLQARSYSRT